MSVGDTGAVGCTASMRTDHGAEGGNTVRSTKCGDATNSELTEAGKSKWVRFMLVRESRSFPASDVLWVDAAGPRYTLLVKTVSTRDGWGVKSGVQITVVVGMLVGNHHRQV